MQRPSFKAVEAGASGLADSGEGWKTMRGSDHQGQIEDVVWGETSYSEKFGFSILKKHRVYTS